MTHRDRHTCNAEGKNVLGSCFFFILSCCTELRMYADRWEIMEHLHLELNNVGSCAFNSLHVQMWA